MENNSDSEVTIRPLSISDADDFIQWYSDKNVSEFCSWDAVTSKEEAIKYFTTSVLNHPWHKAICFSGKPVGYVIITPFEGDERCRAEIGYGITSAYWGRGIATKAVKIAANAIFVEWSHLERLEALVELENPRSRRVLEKAGFTREGVLRKYYLRKGKSRDAIIFSLLSTDSAVNYFIDS